jgi:Domain of unknown function (DUF4160)
MPRISSFYGITISIYYDESHHPGRPHFHAFYGGATASFDIETLAVIVGELPPRACRLVIEWGSKHRRELQENWRRACEHRSLRQIEPLR